MFEIHFCYLRNLQIRDLTDVLRVDNCVLQGSTRGDFLGHHLELLHADFVCPQR